MAVRPPGCFLEEQLSSSVPELVRRLSHRGERDERQGSEGYVVIADDGDVIGEPSATLQDRVLDAQREKVVGGLRCWSSLFAASSPSAIAAVIAGVTLAISTSLATEREKTPAM